jgi:hypothetical protein
LNIGEGTPDAFPNCPISRNKNSWLFAPYTWRFLGHIYPYITQRGTASINCIPAGLPQKDRPKLLSWKNCDSYQQ